MRLLVSNQLDMCACVIGPRVGADSGGSRDGGGGVMCVPVCCLIQLNSEEAAV